MINLKELRLYNWVYSLQIGEYVQIASVDSECVTLKHHVTWDYVYADMIEPIPLTEEILLKCGFVPCSIIDNHFNISGMCIWKCNDMFFCDKNGVHIKHLHQLQNLYFALIGEELKIQL